MHVKDRSKFISYGGILTALGVIFIYLGSNLAFNKIFFLMVSSFLIPTAIILLGTKGGVYVFISTFFLSLFLSGIRGSTISYLIFFGPYGIIKNRIERIKKLPVEILIKILYFSLSLFLLYIISKFFISVPVQGKIGTPYLIVLAEICFVIYDYILTIFIFNIKKHKGILNLKSRR
ncbi:MAG: hypothetical protein E7205_04060 [Tissierellaceae bacterium]|jgi:hypothetical protein|nr:hypothetical protein [Tissierellaceae bacterium]